MIGITASSVTVVVKVVLDQLPDEVVVDVDIPVVVVDEELSLIYS